MINVTEASLVKAPASNPLFDHYLVPLKLRDPYGCDLGYRVFDKTQDGIRWYDLRSYDPTWQTVAIAPESQLQGVMERLRFAAARPRYDAAFSNCEHYARFVVEGRDYSGQAAGWLMLGFCLGAIALSRTGGKSK